MIPPLPWLATFEKGVDALQARSVDAALTFFDEAVKIGGSQLALFASRAEVLDRLQALEGIFDEGSRTAVANEDVARLFRRLTTLPDYLQASIISASTTKTNSIHDLLLQTHALVPLLLRSRPFIDHLPPELLVAVGRFVVFPPNSLPSSDRAFKLVVVSRRWRSIFLADRAIWGDLCLSGKSERELDRVDAYLEKGPLRSLRFYCETGNADTIRSLCRKVGGSETGLRNIVALVGEAESFDFDLLWTLVGSPPLTQVQSLDYLPSRDISSTLRFPSHHLPSLTSLTLVCIILEPLSSSLLPLLRLLPNLASLSVFDCKNLPLILPILDGTSRVELASLTSLTLGENTQDVPAPPFDLIAPLLTSLHLSECESYLHYLYPPFHLPSHHSNLQHLYLSYDRDDLDEANILSRLRQLPSLVSLSLSSFFYNVSDKTIQALTIPQAGEEGIFEGLCPILTTLHLSWNQTSNRAVRRLVASRKVEGRVPLVKLGVTDSRMTQETYDWFETNVATFENEMFGEASEVETESEAWSE